MESPTVMCHHDISKKSDRDLTLLLLATTIKISPTIRTINVNKLCGDEMEKSMFYHTIFLRLFSKISKIEENIIIHSQMVIHLSFFHGLGCLTSVTWPFTLTTFCSCLYCFKFESIGNPIDKKVYKKIYCSSILEMAYEY